jgi:hypothetical protein
MNLRKQIEREIHTRLFKKATRRQVKELAGIVLEIVSKRRRCKKMRKEKQ